MKYKIENLEDITDSREIMQSTPNGFSKYMTYLIISLLSLVIVWSLFAYKEICVKASGTVKPRSEVNKIASNIVGTISELRVKEGDEVKKGDIIVVVNGAEYELKKDLYQELLDKKNKEIDLMNKLKQSLLDGKNNFDSSNSDEEEYSKKYELYMRNINSSDGQNDALQNQKNELNKNIEDLQILQKGIEEEKNYFSSDNMLYYQYNDYEMSIKKYDDAINSCKNSINNINEKLANNSGLGSEDFKVELNAQLESLHSQIESYEAEKKKLKNSTVMSITSQITQYKLSLSQIQLTSNADTYKEQYLANIDSSISNLESACDEIKMNLEVVNLEIDKASIKANSDGVINMLSELKVGDFIQNGTQIASIVPKDQLDYNVEVYINSQSFGEIKEGQEVILELASLPGQEYGYIKSNLKNISVDAKVNQEQGISYYTAVCEIDKNSLVNKKGEEVSIKNGMIVEARIVNRRIPYFRYFLEKIDIID